MAVLTIDSHMALDKDLKEKTRVQDYQDIKLFRISTKGKISSFSADYKEALTLFASYALHINDKDHILILPPSLLKTKFESQELEKKISQDQRDLYFLLLNGKRELLMQTENIPLKYVDSITYDFHQKLINTYVMLSIAISCLIIEVILVLL